MGSANVAVDHYISWHTGYGVTLNLRGELIPGINSLTHNAVMLTVGAPSSLATLALAEVDDGFDRILGVDLNLVEDVGGAHGVVPLTTLVV